MVVHKIEMNQLEIDYNQKLYKDILVKIFSCLPAIDIISCSQVNRKFYHASSDNHLWFELSKVQEKKQLKNPISIYDDKINYKLHYLSLFNQKYYPQIFNFYRDIYHITSLSRNLFEKSLFYSVYIPGAILFFPLIVGIELYECMSHYQKKYEYCSCDSCQRGLLKIRSKYKI
jgi:hypothetical protein